MTINNEDKKRIFTIPRTNEVLSRDGYGARHMKDIKINDACGVCSKREVLPFKCTYCGCVFCSDHRMPEKHNCTYGVREVFVTEEMVKELEERKATPIDVPPIPVVPAPAPCPAAEASAVEEYNAKYGFNEKKVPMDPMASYPKANASKPNPYTLNYHKGPLHPEDANPPSDGADGVKKLFRDEREEKGIVAWLKKVFGGDKR